MIAHYFASINGIKMSNECTSSVNCNEETCVLLATVSIVFVRVYCGNLTRPLKLKSQHIFKSQQPLVINLFVSIPALVATVGCGNEIIKTYAIQPNNTSKKNLI